MAGCDLHCCGEKIYSIFFIFKTHINPQAILHGTLGLPGPALTIFLNSLLIDKAVRTYRNNKFCSTLTLAMLTISPLVFYAGSAAIKIWLP